MASPTNLLSPGSQLPRKNLHVTCAQHAFRSGMRTDATADPLPRSFLDPHRPSFGEASQKRDGGRRAPRPTPSFPRSDAVRGAQCSASATAAAPSASAERTTSLGRGHARPIMATRSVLGAILSSHARLDGRCTTVETTWLAPRCCIPSIHSAKRPIHRCADTWTQPWESIHGMWNHEDRMNYWCRMVGETHAVRHSIARSLLGRWR
eukprot:scaffold287_cov337-Pavlova_lutheri.AAC.239